MVCILYIYIISDICKLCTFFCYFSGIFFRYIGYFTKNVNFPKKFFALGLISWYILEIPRRSFLPLSEWRGLGVFLVWVFAQFPFWNDTYQSVVLRSKATWGSTVYNSGSTWLRYTYSRFLVGRFSLARNDRVWGVFCFHFSLVVHTGDSSSLPCGSSVDSSFRVQLRFTSKSLD